MTVSRRPLIIASYSQNRTNGPKTSYHDGAPFNSEPSLARYADSNNPLTPPRASSLRTLDRHLNVVTRVTTDEKTQAATLPRSQTEAQDSQGYLCSLYQPLLSHDYCSALGVQEGTRAVKV